MFGQVIIVVVTLACLPECAGLTISDVDQLQVEIRTMINDREATRLAPQTFIAGLTRLSFHDCVGGCDGCINKDNPENAGLEVYIDATEIFYQPIAQTFDISRADFWYLAAIEAITLAHERDTCRRCDADPLPLEIKLGRKDCDSGGPYTTDSRTFPDASQSGKHTTQFLAREFGMTEKQAVAIMGAHTLGRAHPGASGYNHRWVKEAGRFNNDYYVSLKDVNFKWKMVQLADRRRTPGKWQWENVDTGTTDALMMLNVDMGLHLHLEGQIDSVGHAGCNYSTCGLNEDLSGLVDEFAKSNSEWLVAFADAFGVMTSNGYTESELSPPTA